MVERSKFGCGDFGDIYSDVLRIVYTLDPKKDAELIEEVVMRIHTEGGWPKEAVMVLCRMMLEGEFFDE